MTIHRRHPFAFTFVVSFLLFAAVIAVGLFLAWPDTTIGGVLMAVAAVISSIYGGWLGRYRQPRR